MWSSNTLKKPFKLALLALSLCLVFAQTIEVLHDHQTLNSDCYLCQHSPVVACGEKAPSIQPPSLEQWQETTPYHRYQRDLDKRGNRDPPGDTPITA